MGEQELVALELPSVTNLDRPMSVGELLRQGQIIHDVLTNAMVEGIHYGKIPGTGDKPTLLQPGAEKICTTFRLAPKARVDDLSEPDRNRYRYRLAVGLYTIKDGLFVGEAVGEASTDEEKYQWEAAVCDEHWDSTDPDNRRIKFKKAGQYASAEAKEAGFEKIKQVRRNAADLSNTVLKIAFKRALVSATRGSTAASDLLEVDLEEEVIGALAQQERSEEKQPAKPKAKAKPAPKLPYGNHKGKEITDASIPVADLEWMANKTTDNLREVTADPNHKRARFKAQDQVFLAALETEIEHRKNNAVKAETVATAGSKTTAEEAKNVQLGSNEPKPFSESSWSDFIIFCEEEAAEAYKIVKATFKVQSGHDVAKEKRITFSEQIMAIVHAS